MPNYEAAGNTRIESNAESQFRITSGHVGLSAGWFAAAAPSVQSFFDLSADESLTMLGQHQTIEAGADGRRHDHLIQVIGLRDGG